MKDIEDVWQELTYEQRLAATAYVFKKIREHAKGGGTFRYLIYDRLGFDTDAYLAVGGMDISDCLSSQPTVQAGANEDHWPCQCPKYTGVCTDCDDLGICNGR